MNVIRDFTRKSLKRNKKRTAVTIIGVVISAAMLTAVTVFFSSFVSLIQRDCIASRGNWHASIADLSVESLPAVIGNDAVDSYFLERNLGYAELDGSVNDSKPYLYVKQYSQSGFSQMSVNLISGRLPENSSEVVISETVENSAGVAYKTGDTISLSLGTRHTAAGGEINGNPPVNYLYNEEGTERTMDDMLVTGAEEEFTIVGVMARPSFEQSWSAGCGVVGFLDESALSADENVNVRFTFKSIDKGLYERGASIAQQAGKSENDIDFHNDLLRYYGVVAYDNVLTFMQVFAGIIIVIIMLASISLIYNSFAISVSERSRQLGLLASVGATKSQKRASVYYEGFIIGVIGIPLGLLAGIGGMAVTLKAIQPLMDSFFYTSSDVTLEIVVPLWIVGATVLLSALTIFISVYVPARRASRIMPIDAIRLANEVRLTRRAVKTSRLTKAIFGFEATIALKNLKRSRKKYRATIVSLVISIVLFLTVSMYASMAQMVTGITQDGVNFDISLGYYQMPPELRESTNKAVESLDLVTDYSETTELSGFLAVTDDMLSDYTKKLIGTANDIGGMFCVSIIAIDDESFAAYSKTLGLSEDEFSDTQAPRAILINYGQDYAPDEGQGLSKISGDILNVLAGDTLTFYLNAESKEQTGKLTIGAVTKERPMGNMIQSFNYCTVVMKAEVFDAFTQGLGDVSSLINHDVYLKTDDDQRLEKQIAQITEKLQPSQVYMYNVKSASRAEQNMLTFLAVFVYGFIILISLICIANIFNTVSTNIALRRREFAMLRSVGMTPKGFNRMIRFESIFYGLKGLLFGLPISVAVAYLLYNVQSGVVETGFTLPWSSYGFVVLMILVIVFTTMIYSTSKIKKENIIDALKDENI